MIQAFITGRIGKDAVIRAAGKDNVCAFSVASTRRSKDGDITTWIDCSLFGKRGETLCQYLTKGNRVAVAGELSTREHNGKTYLQIRVSEIDLMGGKRDRKRVVAESLGDPDETPGYTRHKVDETDDIRF